MCCYLGGAFDEGDIKFRRCSSTLLVAHLQPDRVILIGWDALEGQLPAYLCDIKVCLLLSVGRESN